MNELLTVVASGLAAASFYITYGLGLALVYRSTGILNFAYGAVGSAAGYFAYTLLGDGLPYGVAAVLAILLGVMVSTAIPLVILRFLPSESPEIAGIATLGVTILIEGILVLIYGSMAFALPSPLAAQTLFSIGNYHVQTITLVDVAVAIIAICLVGLLLYRSKTGLAIRANSEGSHTAAMFGISPQATQAVVWGAAGALASITALLVTPTYYLTPDFLTDYLIAAFVVVVLGGFESLRGVALGAVIFGIIQSLFATYVTGSLTSTLSFGIILLVLMVLPYGILGRPLPRVPEAVLPRIGNAWARRLFQSARRSGDLVSQDRTQKLRSFGSRRIMYAGPVLAGVLALLISHFLSSSIMVLGTNIAATFIAVMGVDVIFGYTGQLSIGQSGFMMVGAYVAALLAVKSGVPFLLTLLAATASGAALGVIFGLPVARLRGIYLAVLTLGFALSVPELASYFISLTGGDNGITIAIPSWIGSGADRTEHIYMFLVIVAVLVTFIVMMVTRSRWGRSWRSIRDSDAAAAAVGVRAARGRIAAFAFGSALCALSGALLASVTSYLSPESFTLWTSIYLLVAVVVGGRVSIVGALLGAAFIETIPYESASVPALANLLMGALLIVVLVLRPNGLRSLLVDLLAWLTRIVPRSRGSLHAVPETQQDLSIAAPTDRRPVAHE